MKTTFLTLVAVCMLGACAAPQTSSADSVPAEISTTWDGWNTDGVPPLQNIPLILRTEREPDFSLVNVTIKNAGETTLQYSGYSSGQMRQLQEVWQDGAWTSGRWDGCGYGARSCDILPGETVTFRAKFHDAVGMQRILVTLHEKGTDRRGQVVLVTQLPYEKD
ncbi:MAG: hypothetical protein ACPG31_01600 [Planctomycetota bacterium]